MENVFTFRGGTFHCEKDQTGSFITRERERERWSHKTSDYQRLVLYSDRLMWLPEWLPKWLPEWQPEWQPELQPEGLAEKNFEWLVFIRLNISTSKTDWLSNDCTERENRKRAATGQLQRCEQNWSSRSNWDSQFGSSFLSCKASKSEKKIESRDGVSQRRLPSL